MVEHTNSHKNDFKLHSMFSSFSVSLLSLVFLLEMSSCSGSGKVCRAFRTIKATTFLCSVSECEHHSKWKFSLCCIISFFAFHPHMLLLCLKTASAAAAAAPAACCCCSRLCKTATKKHSTFFFVLLSSSRVFYVLFVLSCCVFGAESFRSSFVAELRQFNVFSWHAVALRLWIETRENKEKTTKRNAESN